MSTKILILCLRRLRFLAISALLMIILLPAWSELTNHARAAGDVMIYADALNPGWQNWSWDSTVSFANATPVHSGSASIAVTFTAAWGGLYLHADTG